MNATTPETNVGIPPAIENYTDLPVGEILRRTRVHYGQSLKDAEAYLRIRASQLDALEKGEIDKLPGRAYAIGYVRTYSEYLGLDGEKMIQLFKIQSGGRTSKPDLHFPVPASESKGPNIGMIIGSMTVFILLIGVWVLLNATGKHKDANVNAVPDVPADIRVNEPVAKAAPAEVTTSVQIPAAEETSAVVNGMVPDASDSAVVPSTPAQSASATMDEVETELPPQPELKREIMITVKQKTWAEVRDQDGKAILSRVLKPGEVFLVPEENYGLRLDTGNAGGLEVQVNGVVLPPLGKQGDILRGVVLDGDALSKKFLPPKAANQ